MSALRVVAAVFLSLVAGSGWAQGLGDKAAKERAKRAQSKAKDARVFTNTDLDAGRPPSAKKEDGSGAAAGGAEPSPPLVPIREGGGSPDAPEDDRRVQERGYVDAVGAAQGQLSAVEARIRELQGRLNPMSTTYIYGAGGSNDANEEQRVRSELRQAEDELVSARQAVADANQNLQDFRQGRPVGDREPR